MMQSWMLDVDRLPETNYEVLVVDLDCTNSVELMQKVHSSVTLIRERERAGILIAMIDLNLPPCNWERVTFTSQREQF